MKVTIIKGVLQDRLLVGFWVGSEHQNLVLSVTELTHIMSQRDIDEIAKNPVGIWKAKVQITLEGGVNERT